MTNAEHIKSMTNEGIADWLIHDLSYDSCNCCIYLKPCRLEYDEETVDYSEKYDCKTGIMEWLNRPFEEDKTDD